MRASHEEYELFSDLDQEFASERRPAGDLGCGGFSPVGYRPKIAIFD
jgi:hypothetical protein